MIARVDSAVVATDILWWPEMNFGQFRWDAAIGVYELEIPRSEFVFRLDAAYLRLVAELQEDDLLVPDDPASPLTAANYPSLDLLPDNPPAFTEAILVYLWDEVFGAFLPDLPTAAARFMVNSVEQVAASRDLVVIRGRGYHAKPGFAKLP